MSPPPIRCVLWDFGDTLVDQDWMLVAPDGVPDWQEAWVGAARGDREEAWNLGEVRGEEIARRVADRLGLSLREAVGHIRSRCERIRFFDRVMDVVRRCPLPQAIVTVNPDLFTVYVEPRYRLRELFPVIVASWQERTVDKAELCARAIERLDGAFAPAEALLVDNIEPNVRAWEARGGRGYVFRGEERFVADLGTDLRELLPTAGEGSPI